MNFAVQGYQHIGKTAAASAQNFQIKPIKDEKTFQTVDSVTVSENLLSF